MKSMGNTSKPKVKTNIEIKNQKGRKPNWYRHQKCFYKHSIYRITKIMPSRKV